MKYLTIDNDKSVADLKKKLKPFVRRRCDGYVTAVVTVSEVEVELSEGQLRHNLVNAASAGQRGLWEALLAECEAVGGWLSEVEALPPAPEPTSEPAPAEVTP